MRRFTAVLAMAATLGAANVAQASHTFDMNQHMPPHLAVMFTMAWFGIDKNDPGGPGPENGYGNWRQNFPACGLSNDPATCTDFQGAGLQRSIASKRRPMAGIYSATGRDAESLRRIDFNLSMLRRPCDQGAKLDAWAVQLDSVKFTSKYPVNKQGNTWDIAYRATLAYLDEADKANLESAVMVADDSTIYWHFGSNFGLTTQAQRVAALEDDVVDMVDMAMAHPSSVKLDGKPLLAFYVDSALISVAEWQSILDGARTRTGQDFYALGTTLNATFFGAFDGLAPWVNLGMWANNASISDTHDRAVAWAGDEHAKIRAALPSYPGRVFFGGVAPGFDDYTENWGACQAREIPRDPALLTGEFDYLASVKQEVDLRGVFFETWDDWTEGTEFEPDVVEGPAKLLALRQQVGKLFGEPDDPTGDQALSDAWSQFGQARNCCFAGGACPPPGPPVDPTCPADDGGVDGGTAGAAGADAGAAGSTATGGSTGTGGAGGSGGVTSSGGSGGTTTGDASTDAAPGAASGSDSGCGCRAAPARSSRTLPLLLLGLAGLVRRRRARRPT